MARIKYSGLVDSINGSIGGTTFQRNKYGFSVKHKPNMNNPSRIGQAAQKNQMSTVAKQWRTLTELQRTAWETFAEANPRPTRLNPDSYLSGYNLFLMYQRYRWLYNKSILPSPSLTLQDMGEIEAIVYRDGANLIWETNPQDLSGDWAALLYLTSKIPLGREFVNTTPRLLERAFYDNPDTFTITNSYLNTFGQLPITGDWLGYKIVLICLTSAQVIVSPISQTQVG